MQDLLELPGLESNWTLELAITNPGKLIGRQDFVWEWGPHLLSLYEVLILGSGKDLITRIDGAGMKVTAEATGWVMCARVDSGRASNMVYSSHGAKKSRVLHASSGSQVHEIDLMNHNHLLSPVQASLLNFVSRVRQASIGGVNVSDELLTRFITSSLTTLDGRMRT